MSGAGDRSPIGGSHDGPKVNVFILLVTSVLISE